jgi:tetratricopeptide (TPR) repeat protein
MTTSPPGTEAEQLYLKAVEYSPREWMFLHELAGFYYFEAQYDKSIAYWRQASEFSSGDNVMVLGNLGDSYRRAEGLKSNAGPAYEQAIGLVRDMLAKTPDDSGIRSSLAVYLAKLGDTAGALAELAQVEKVPGRDKGILFKSALVYEVAGDRAKALAALRRAIEAGYSRLEIANEPELAKLRSDPGYPSIAGAGVALKK